MGAGEFRGKAGKALDTLTSGAEKSKDPSDILLTKVNTHYRVAAYCGACHRRTKLDMRRMLLRSDVGTTLGGLRSRLTCKACHSRRTKLELSLSPRD